MNIKNMKISTLVCLVLALFSGVYITQSLHYDYWHGYGPGAGFVPLWSSGIMLTLCLISLFQSFRMEGIRLAKFFPAGAAMGNIIVTCLGLIFFAVFSNILGMVITSTAMLALLFGRSLKWTKALLYSGMVSVCCFVLFKIILQVPVPTNQFGW